MRVRVPETPPSVGGLSGRRMGRGSKQMQG